MPSQSINDYEEKLKAYIMNSLVDSQLITLEQLFKELMQENPDDYKVIKHAYRNVENELTGDNDERGEVKNLCE